jgi:catechol 2,3-dioxygenase-like lactoylglutathione lyase family enzyme
MTGPDSILDAEKPLATGPAAIWVRLNDEDPDAMQTAQLLHFAFRARDPERLAHFYADVFEGNFFLHPVMTPLGIMMVKFDHPEALFHGLIEFWPWDVVWDSNDAVFRRVEAKPSPMSYGHVAFKINASQDEVVAELKRRGVAYRIEPRGPHAGLYIPTIDDPEGNLIELFPNVDTMPVPPEAICPPARATQAIAALRRAFTERTSNHPPEQGYSLTT